MEIIQYTPDLLTPLTKFYDDFTVDVPHCYPVKEADLEFATRVVLQVFFIVMSDIRSLTRLMNIKSNQIIYSIHSRALYNNLYFLRLRSINRWRYFNIHLT